REIARRARPVLGDVQEIIDLAASSKHGLYGTLRLGVPSTLGPYLLPYIVPELHTRYPDLKLYVKEGKPKDLQEQLQAGDFDLLVLPVPITSKEIAVELLFREPLLVTVARDHPLAKKKSLTRADLAGESVLTIEQGHHLHEYVRTICEDIGATLLRDYEGTSLDTVRIMAGMGVGIAFLPSLYVRSEIGSRQEVVVVDVSGLTVHRQIALAWRKSSVNAAQFAGIAELMRDISAKKLPEVTVIR
ncbi:MAG: LysR substrate-binding domain-containing protein, partial [Proteobacteria bacterium]|nr:LysR substrate-binding domain-containing protein [Pseudomonadota bacterium]